MYLTENNLAFYSYTFGKEAKLLLRWTDVTKVEKTNNYVRPDSIRVATRESEYVLVFRLPKRDVRSGAGGKGGNGVVIKNFLSFVLDDH